MAVLLPGVIRKNAARPVRYGTGNALKIGIVGTYTQTLWSCPWHDPSWLFWGNSSAYNKVPPGRLDLLIDTHPKFCFSEARKNGFKNYFEFLKRCRTPILMQNTFEDVPASIRYPYEQVLTEFPHLEYKSMTAQLIAYALLMGATDIGFWGVEYGHQTEQFDGQGRFYQRDNCRLWVGIAYGRGVRIHTPPGCTLLHDNGMVGPREDYGFSLTLEKYQAAKEALAAAIKKNQPFAPAGLVDVNTVDDAQAAAATRAKDPDWVKESDKIKHEEMPDEFLHPDDAAKRRALVLADLQRAIDLAKSAGGAAGPDDPGAVSAGSADPQGAPGGPNGAGDGGQSDVGAGAGEFAGGGDGAVQPALHVGAKPAAHARRVQPRARPTGRATVARVRGAAGRRRATGRGRTRGK